MAYIPPTPAHPRAVPPSDREHDELVGAIKAREYDEGAIPGGDRHVVLARIGRQILYEQDGRYHREIHRTRDGATARYHEILRHEVFPPAARAGAPRS